MRRRRKPKGALGAHEAAEVAKLFNAIKQQHRVVTVTGYSAHATGPVIEKGGNNAGK